jgi:hypothetical protein
MELVGPSTRATQAPTAAARGRETRPPTRAGHLAGSDGVGALLVLAALASRAGHLAAWRDRARGNG